MRLVHVFRLAAIISRNGAFVVLRSSVRNQALKFQMVKKHMPRSLQVGNTRRNVAILSQRRFP